MKLLTLLIFLFLVAPAQAAIYWASPSGGAGSCGAASGTSDPGVYRTLVEGSACLASGDTLYLKGGNYFNPVLMVNGPAYNINYVAVSMASGTSWASPTTWASAPGETAVLRCSQQCGEQVNSGILAVVDGAWFVFDRLVLDGIDFNGAPAHDWDSGFALLNVTQVSHWKFQNGEIRNAIDGYFMSGGGITDGQMLNNKMHDSRALILGGGTGCGQSQCWGYPMYWGASNGLIEGNEIWNFPSFGIHLYSTNSLPSNNIVRNNIIHDFSTRYWPTPQPGAVSGGDPRGTGILITSGTNNVAYNNIVYNGSIGMTTTLGGNNMQFYNNTVYDMEVAGVSILNSGAVVTNNIVANVASGANNQLLLSAGSATWTTNLCSVAGTNCAFSGNPNFVNAATHNFHLLTGSPAINAGTNLGFTYSPDLSGIPRPTSGPWEIGAYEFTVGAPAIAITGPTSSPTYTTSLSTITVTGTADASSDITYTCDRCTSTAGNGVGSISWALPSLTLKAGINVITVIATTASNQSSDSIIVTYAPTFPGNSLVLAMPFEEGSANTTADLSGNGHTGTLIGNPTWAGASGGRWGNAVSFNGFGQYITVPDSNSLDFTQSFTISLWVKPSVANTDFRSLVTKDGPPFQFFASVLGYCGDGGVAGFVGTNGISGPSGNACSSAPLQINVWTHLAFSYDNSTLTLYKNGVPVATQALTGYMEPTSGVLYIANSQFNEFFQGAIDELRLYNYAIPATGGANTTFGNNCNRADELSAPSVIGDANCSITAPSSPITIQLGSGTSFKAGSAVKLGTQ